MCMDPEHRPSQVENNLPNPYCILLAGSMLILGRLSIEQMEKTAYTVFYDRP